MAARRNRVEAGSRLRIPLRNISRVAAALVACGLLAGPAAAQAVSGSVRSEGTGRPVVGALVTLEHLAGGEAGVTLSDTAGAYRVAVPAAGTYRLRVARVGHPDVLSPPLVLGAAGTLSYSMDLPETALLTLEGLRVEASPRCGRTQQGGPGLERVWAAARTALRLTARTTADSLLGFEYTTYVRELDAGGRRILRDSTSRGRSTGGIPFSSLPADSLARAGYVQLRPETRELVFHGPDAEVLLSGTFLDTHCFRLRGGRRGMAGLAFEPTGEGRGVDVRGTLWLDAATAELRHLEFSYAGLPQGAAGELGGRLEFARTLSGAWIVRRWSLRWPLAPTEFDVETGILRVGRIYGVREVGGEVTQVTPARRTPLPSAGVPGTPSRT